MSDETEEFGIEFFDEEPIDKLAYDLEKLIADIKTGATKEFIIDKLRQALDLIGNYLVD